MRQSWTDDRLDDLNAKVDDRFDVVDRRFAQVDQRFDRVESAVRILQVDTKAEFDALRVEMKAGFDRVDDRFESMYRLLLQLGGLGFAALIGLVAAQI